MNREGSADLYVYKLFLISAVLILAYVGCMVSQVSNVSANSYYIKPKHLSPADSIVFRKAFKQSWHLLKLDEYLDESNNLVKAIGYSDKLPVWDLQYQCAGKKMYYFDFDEYNVKKKSGKLYNFGIGYSGSAGTKKLILALDEANQMLEVVFGDNIIDLIGVESSINGSSECADLFIELSGISFEEAESNNDYGVSRLVFDPKTEEYKRSGKKYKGKLIEKK